MGLFDTLSEIEIDVVMAGQSPPPQLIKLLKKLKQEATPQDIEFARKFDRELVKINLVEPEADNDEKPIRSVKVDIRMGNTIDDAAKSAIYLSGILESAPVNFNFNGVNVVATSADKPEEVVAKWRNDMDAEGERKQAEREAYLKTPEGIAELAAEKAAAEADDRALDAAQKIIDKTELKLKDPKRWQETADANKGPFGEGILLYAERWGKLMQHEIEVNGKSLPEIADSTDRLADNMGMSGWSSGVGLALLAKTWEYGEDLRKWHNGQYGITSENDTGGVVNPAVISLGAAISGSSAKPAQLSNGSGPAQA